MKREAKFQTKFNRWLRYVYLPQHKGGGVAFELKHTQDSSISFASLRPHQKDYLMAAKSGKGIIHKIADDSMGYKPFDCFVLKSCEAYVVISFAEGFFVLIDIDDWVREQNTSTRKSLTADRAKEIAKLVVKKGSGD